MLKELAVAAAYVKAPRLTLVARHPKTGVAALAVAQGLKEIRTARRVVGGLIGLGAASVALPALAILLLRR
jgi:hypothetical protein